MFRIKHANIKEMCCLISKSFESNYSRGTAVQFFFRRGYQTILSFLLPNMAFLQK